MNWQAILNEQLTFVIFLVLAAATLLCLLIDWVLYARLAFYRNSIATALHKPSKGVSVVIAAKNEYANLQRNLPLILEQSHPDFEVIVVNNGSEDDSIHLLHMLAEKHSHLKIVEIKKNLNFFYGKKFPLSMGIKSAKNDHLVLTDADCRPTSKEWLIRMQQNFTDSCDIVLGYAPYEPTRGLLNRIIRYEALVTAQNYLSMALLGIPYMGVGRNLAYKKSMFYENHGFTSHYNLASGDDDLFINKVAKASNTKIEISPESQMLSPAKRTLATWWRQKKRHFSTSSKYKQGHKMILALIPFSLVLHYSVAVFLFIMRPEFWLPVLVFLLIRLFSHLFILKKCMQRLHEKDLLLISPVIEIVLLLLHTTVAVSNIFSKQRRWD